MVYEKKVFNVDKSNGYFQLIIPVEIDNVFLRENEVDIEKCLFEKGFILEENLGKEISDLLFFNVVKDTYNDMFNQYRLTGKQFDFFLEKKLVGNVENKVRKTFLKMNVLELNVVVPCNNLIDKKMIEGKTIMTFSLLLNASKKQCVEINGKTIDILNEDIVGMLSLYIDWQKEKFCNQGQNWVTNRSFLRETTTGEFIDFVHGGLNGGLSIPYRDKFILNFLNIKSFKEIETKLNKGKNSKSLEDKKYETYVQNAINFINAKNIFVNYHICDDELYKNLYSAVNVGNEIKQSDTDLLFKICHGKNYNQVYLSADEYFELVKRYFFRQWQETGCIYVCGTNSFGMIANNKCNINGDIMFSKYSLALFFSLYQRLLNISLQEYIKGVKSNGEQFIESYYNHLESVVFYEVSSEYQVQKLYDKLQANFRNNEITALITAEMEFHQNRRLNSLFKKLTEIGIYIAVISFVIAVPSYLATYLGVNDPRFSKIDHLLAGPLITFGFLIISIIIVYIYLKKVKYK